ncbi:unnamed protein product [Closterium sp. Yama58-4]|nr:unnamed protein product [Closterium sp. Yama58-4]
MHTARTGRSTRRPLPPSPSRDSLRSPFCSLSSASSLSPLFVVARSFSPAAMGRKKKFVDKKNAASFTLMYRESNDPDAPGERVFVRTDAGSNHVPGFSDDYQPPIPENAEDYSGEEWEEEEEEEEGGEGEGEGRSVAGSRRSRAQSHAVARATDGDDAASVGGRSRASTMRGGGRGRDLWAGLGLGRPPGWDGGSVMGGGSVAGGQGKKKLSESARREIIELGLPDDGYDYTQHLRVIGQTRTFASFVPAEAPPAALPDDVKIYKATRLTVRPDTSAATTAAADAPVADLEVVAKISSVIKEIRPKRGFAAAAPPSRAVQSAAAASAGAQAGEAAGGEGSANYLGVSGLDPEVLALLEGDGGEVEAGEGEEGEEVYGELEDDFGDGEEARRRAEEEAKSRAQAEENLRALEEHVMLLAEREYADADVDDFSDDEDGDHRGGGGAAGHADISMFSNVLDDFLEASRRESLLELRKGGAVVRMGKGEGGGKGESGGKGEGGGKGESGGKGEGAENGESGRKGESGGTKEGGEMKSKEDGEEEEVEYVSEEEEERERGKWDCESIVSTYSNLDNHPARISAPSNSRRKGSRAGEAAAGGGGGVGGGGGRIGVEEIRLKGKAQLPAGFVPGRVGREGRDGEEGRGSGKGGGLQGIGEDEEGVGEGGGGVVFVRPRGKEKETPEEKKARKEAVKAQKRAAREAKKQTKEMYKVEGKKAQRGAASTVAQGIHLL